MSPPRKFATFKSFRNFPKRKKTVSHETTTFDDLDFGDDIFKDIHIPMRRMVSRKITPSPPRVYPTLKKSFLAAINTDWLELPRLMVMSRWNACVEIPLHAVSRHRLDEVADFIKEHCKLPSNLYRLSKGYHQLLSGSRCYVPIRKRCCVRTYETSNVYDSIPIERFNHQQQGWYRFVISIIRVSCHPHREDCYIIPHVALVEYSPL